MAENFKSQGLFGLSHFRSSRAAQELFEPVYQNLFTVQLSLPTGVGSTEENTVSNLSANFSAGVDEVASKIPTVLLVAAIVLILGVLALLVGTWQRMGMGTGGGI